MTDPKHVREAMLRVLVDNTDLSHVILKKIVERQLIAMANSKELLRGTKLEELPTFDVERLLRVIAAVND